MAAATFSANKKVKNFLLLQAIKVIKKNISVVKFKDPNS